MHAKHLVHRFIKNKSFILVDPVLSLMNVDSCINLFHPCTLLLPNMPLQLSSKNEASLVCCVAGLNRLSCGGFP